MFKTKILGNNGEYLTIPDALATSKNPSVQKAKLYILDNIQRTNITLDEISDHVKLSKNYFCQLFATEEKRTFTAYLNVVRIEMASTLLKTTNWKICEISRTIGYGSAKYFNYVFHQTIGMTPRDFRKFHKQQG